MFEAYRHVLRAWAISVGFSQSQCTRTVRTDPNEGLVFLEWHLWWWIRKISSVFFNIAQYNKLGLHCRLFRQCLSPITAGRISSHHEQVSRRRSPRVRVDCKWRIRVSLSVYGIIILVRNSELETVVQKPKSQTRLEQLATCSRYLIHGVGNMVTRHPGQTLKRSLARH